MITVSCVHVLITYANFTKMTYMRITIRESLTKHIEMAKHIIGVVLTIIMVINIVCELDVPKT